jgi:hypothetical protein
MQDDSVIEVSPASGGATAPSEVAQEVEKQTGETTTPEDSSLDDTADDPAAESRKHKGGFQRRIDELTRRVAEERREKERLLALVETTVKRPETAQQAPEVVEPQRDQFETYEEYLDARAAYKAEKALETRMQALEEARARESQRAQVAETHRAWQTKVAEASARIPDFYDVVSQTTAPTTPIMSQAIVESPVGAELTYFLAQNPAEAARIAALSPARQAAEIGKLEDKVSKPAKASSAPEPIKPVGGRSGVADLLSDKLPIDQWAKNFEKQFYRDRR